MADVLEGLTAALSGRYHLERELGQGGMATVYLAEDLKHDRKVAIKVLKPELAAVLGADRFVTEIKTTAALQHPNILPLFDSGEVDGFLFYVMPFVEGETLRDKLDREQQLGIDDAVRTTTEVAEALDYAHRHGVVHRDIKPENILLHDGRPMVADFGIALAVSAAAGGRMTETGLSLGTPHYMSPEQATAERNITARSDIYSLGAVLYEMLTGDPPHVGKSAQQIIAKIVTDVPRPVTQIRKSVPLNVAAAVSKALEKLPADRFESAKAFAEALTNPSFRTEAVRTASLTALPPYRLTALLAILAAAAILVFGIVLGRRSARNDAPFDVGLPYDARMEVAHAPERTFAVSPDGSFVIYVVRNSDGTEQLQYQSLDGTSARPIAVTVSPAFAPMISPDGKRVAFASASGGIWVIPIAGGAANKVSESLDAWGGGWLQDGILFSAGNDNTVLHWVDPENGPVRDLPVAYCPMPSLLSPRQVICGGGAQKFASIGDVDRKPFTLRPVMQIRAGGERLPLRGAGFRLFDGNYLVYTSIDATIMATKFVDRDSLLVGRSVALVPGVQDPTYSGDGFWAVSRNGALVYAPGSNMQRSVFVRRPLDSLAEVLPGDPAEHLRFNMSPDRREMASVVDGVRDQELRLYDLQTGKYELLAHGRYLSTPFWTSDGRALVYMRQDTDSSRAVRQRLNSSEPPTVLLTLANGENPPMFVQFVEPALLLIATNGRHLIAVDASVKPARVDSVNAPNTDLAQISPNRRWLVWRDAANGMYLSPWPKLDRRWTLSTGQPYEPYWLPHGDLMIHDVNGKAYTIAIHPNGDPPHGPLTLRFDDPRMGESPGWSNAVTSDGAVIYPLMPDQPYIDYLRVVPNWLKQMEHAVDKANK